MLECLLFVIRLDTNVAVVNSLNLNSLKDWFICKMLSMKYFLVCGYWLRKTV